MAIQRICSIEGCGKKVFGRGWCQTHYHRWWAHGDVMHVTKPSDLSAGHNFFHNVAMRHDTDECLIWPYGKTAKNGYAAFSWGGKASLVSRVICEHVYGPPPTPSHQAAHSCGNGHLACVNPRHLRWATPTENLADCVIHGTNKKLASRAKLSDDQIRAMRIDTRSARIIGAEYGVSRGVVDRVRRQLGWTAEIS